MHACYSIFFYPINYYPIFNKMTKRLEHISIKLEISQVKSTKN